MAVNFYDVNFNQNADGSSSGLTPAISGYIIDDDGYENRITYEGKISEGNLISKASATNNIQGAIGMARKQITVNDNTIVCCPLLQGNNIYVVYSDTIATVTIVDDSGTVIESLTLPYDSNSSNLSFIGHFNANNELDWLSVCCSHRDDATGTIMYIINTTGFSSAFTNAMDDYTYLKYKYPYQVALQTTLRGSSNFIITKTPQQFYDCQKHYQFGGSTDRFSRCVCRMAGPTAYFDSVVGTRSIFNNTWKNGKTPDILALEMVNYLETQNCVLGSDILRSLNGAYYNGADLSNLTLAYNPNTPHNIEFDGGKLSLFKDSSDNVVLKLLDDNSTVLDQFVFSWYSGASPSNTHVVGEYGYGKSYSPSIINMYLCEYNNHYFLMALWQYGRLTTDSGYNIDSTYYETVFYTKAYEFSNAGTQLLYNATEEGIMPTDPDSLTTDVTSNQTSDPDHKNEYGNEIPHPKYSDGDWGDGTNDGIRGSGNGQPTGGDAEKNLDQQPDLPDEPNIPTSVSTGFMKLYAPTESEIQDLCIELTDDSMLTTLKKYFGNNPLDFIVGLQVVPGEFTTDTTRYKIQYGSYVSKVAMCPITDEFTTLDYGELDLKEIYGSWEDYNPHTKMTIYLPYLGIKEINPDLINGTLLKLKYHIDACTGSILAVLTSVRKDDSMSGKEIVVGQWAGQASYTIPLTNTQHDASVNAILGIVGATAGIGLAVATGGASALVTAGAVGSVGNALLSGAKSQKTDISTQGSVGGGLSFFTGKDAYIQIEFPKEGRPDEYNHIIGMPSNITTTIAEQPLNNYIEFVNVDVSGIDAPSDEKNAIINLLKGGVYT